MKKINVTFSIPEETIRSLQLLVDKMKMSAFVTKLINEELAKEKAALAAAY